VNFILGFSISKQKFEGNLSTSSRIIVIFMVFATMQVNVSLMMLSSVGYYIMLNLNEFIDNSIEGKTFCPERKLFKLATEIHNKICEVFEKVSEFYSVLWLVTLLLTAFLNVLNVFILFLLLKVGGSEIELFIITTMAWALVCLPPVIWVVAYASAMQSQSLETGKLFTKLSTRRRNLKDLEQAQVFQLLLSHRTPKISCGMFKLDWKFFFSFVCCIFSFSIIVIQFSDV
jgi:7tm Chemosensory receptor